MAAQARYSDLTIGIGTHGKSCCPHCFVGIIIQGSPNTDTNSLQTTRIGDIGIHFCPHCPTNMMIGGSPNVYTNNIPNHRLGDIVTEYCGMGFTVTGSSDTFVNGK